MPLLSEIPTISEKKKTIDDRSPTQQTMAKGVYRFVRASWLEIPSGNGLLLKVHQDIKPGRDNKPNCHPNAEVSICMMGHFTGVSEQQRPTKTKRGYKESFNKRNGIRELPQFQPGD